MSSVNRVTILGNLGCDPELRATQAGNDVATLSVATSEKWKDKQTGQVREETEWHRVVLFGGLAKVAGDHLAKGDPVYIVGRNRTRRWQDRDGNDRYTTEVIGSELKLIHGRSRSHSGSTEDRPTHGHQEMEDDIPF